MAGTSPYFHSSRNSSKVAAEAVRRCYQTRRSKIKIEYEPEATAVKIKKEDVDSTIHEGVSSKIPSTKAEFQPMESKNISIKEEDLISHVKKEDVEWEPKNWEIILERIKEMRKDRSAIVDTLGCERSYDISETVEVIRFQTLTSLLLSAQTKDPVTYAAVQRLRERGLNPQNVCKMSEEEVGKLIYPVGFWKRKASFLKKCAKICRDDYGGDIPSTLEGLMALPGVGPKMAHICMSAAWDVLSGIGVDTHVHRIANRLRWVRQPTKIPDNTRKELESWLPRSEWKDINILLVGFGQQICLPIAPKCESCLIKDICPSAFSPRNKRQSPKKQKLNR